MNLIVEEYGGTLPRISFLESLVSPASIAYIKVCEAILGHTSFQALTDSMLTVTVAVYIISLRPGFIFLVLLVFIVRMGDAAWFLFNRN